MKASDYLADYGRGLWLAKLDWVPMTEVQARAHAAPMLEKVRQGRQAADERAVRRKVEEN